MKTVNISFIRVALVLPFFFTANAFCTTVVLHEMPAYSWYHGCGPTAAGSIIGYYDLHGYDNLFNASGWDEVRQTANVQDEISSPEHNAKYNPTPDNPALPEPADTSIADFFHTSEDSYNYQYGWSNIYEAADTFMGYASYRGYSDWIADSVMYSEQLWDWFIYEINANRPLMFLLDTDGNGENDHFAPVLGYNDETYQYGCYTTWTESEDIAWFDFQGIANPWGIGGATFIFAGDPDPVPEPSTLILLTFGFLGLAATKRKKR